MDIYIVVIEDRHADVSVYPFHNQAAAISEAKRCAKEYCRFKEDYKEIIYTPDSNYGEIFRAKYSCDGDCAKVIKAEVGRCVL